jgi:hypothetical protein
MLAVDARRRRIGPEDWPGRVWTLLAATLLAGCGGGLGGAGPGNTSMVVAARLVSSADPLGAGCGLAMGSASDAYTPGSAVQPQLAVGAAGPALAAVWEQDRWNAIGSRAIAFSQATGATQPWSAPVALPFSACGATVGAGAGYDRASDPSVTIGHTAGGTPVIVASALAFSAANYLAAGGQSGVLVTRSLDGGQSWQAPWSAIADVGAAGAPVYFNDRDAIAADPNSSNVYLVWDRISSDLSASMPTWLAHSGDGGASWDAARVIYDPGTAGQTFNNQPQVLPDQSVVIIFTLVAGGFGPQQLAAIRSTDHGATWPASGAASPIATMTPVGTANPIAGGPPVRDSAGMAQTAVDPVSGTLAAVWQESSFSGGQRDGIALSLSTDQAASWSAPIQVNAVPGVAAFNPSVRFGADGRIGVTYYDFRGYVAGSGVLSTQVWLRQSSDGGLHWTEARLDGPFDLNRAPPADQQAGNTGRALFLGDQQGLGWTGSDWAALFAAADAPGARIHSAIAP